MTLRSILFLVLSAAAITVSGCKTIKTPEGKVPEAYLALTQSYAGGYQGKIDGTSDTGLLSLDIDSEGLAQLSFSKDNYPADLLDAECGSTIGKLLQFTVSQSRLTEAEFEFNPGRCEVLGRTVTLQFKKNGAMKVSILAQSTPVWHEGTCIPGPDGGSESCMPGSTDYWDSFYEGKFKKKMN